MDKDRKSINSVLHTIARTIYNLRIKSLDENLNPVQNFKNISIRDARNDFVLIA
jgi:hypothetical protein